MRQNTLLFKVSGPANRVSEGSSFIYIGRKRKEKGRNERRKGRTEEERKQEREKRKT